MSGSLSIKGNTVEAQERLHSLWVRDQIALASHVKGVQPNNHSNVITTLCHPQRSLGLGDV